MLPEFTGHCSTEIFPIKPQPGLTREFLKYWLSSDAVVEQIDGTSTGARMPRANMNAVLDFEFFFPPLPEQRRIVGILDKAFAAIATAKANVEENLQNAHALFDNHLNSVFTSRHGSWPTKALGEICEFQGGSQPPKSTFIYAARKGYVRFLQIRDFASEKHITFIPQSEKNRLCREEDIMLGRYGASVGKVLTGRAGAYNVALMKAVPNLVILDRTFFYYYLTSGAFQDRLTKVAARSAQDGFSKEDIYGFPVPVPSIREQRLVIEGLTSLSEETQRLECIYQQKLAALEALKKSLLHQAFHGEL
jgi:type I restriction enzyme S subunit